MDLAPDRSTSISKWFRGAILVLSSLASLSAQAADPAAPRADERADAAKDRDRFQGTWKCKRLEVFGEPLSGDAQSSAQNPLWKVIFKGDRLFFVEDDGKPSDPMYTVRWNPSAQPRQIDLDGIPRDETLAGIYKLEGDTLTLCLTMDKDSPIRPTRFATRKGLPLFLFSFQRDNGPPTPPSGSR